MQNEQFILTPEFLQSQGFNHTFEKRFWAKVIKNSPDDPDGCWGWIGANRYGYGIIGKGGRGAGDLVASRASWIIHYGSIPSGLWVLHQCDHPPCSRPDHLFLGTPKDNSQDAAKKGRMATGDRHSSVTRPEMVARGIRHGNAILDDDIVRSIWELAQSMKQQDVAEIVGICRTTVTKILRGRAWKHVKHGYPIPPIRRPRKNV